MNYLSEIESIKRFFLSSGYVHNSEKYSQINRVFKNVFKNEQGLWHYRIWYKGLTEDLFLQSTIHYPTCEAAKSAFNTNWFEIIECARNESNYIKTGAAPNFSIYLNTNEGIGKMEIPNQMVAPSPRCSTSLRSLPV